MNVDMSIRPSEAMMADIRSVRSFRLDDLIQTGVKSLRKNLKISPQMSEEELLRMRNVLLDIWDRAGGYVLLNERRLEVTEAAYKAAFVVLNDIESIHPWRFDHLFEEGHRILSHNIARYETFEIEFRAMLEVFKRSLHFAETNKAKAWSPAKDCTLALEARGFLLKSEKVSN